MKFSKEQIIHSSETEGGTEIIVDMDNPEQLKCVLHVIAEMIAENINIHYNDAELLWFSFGEVDEDDEFESTFEDDWEFYEALCKKYPALLPDVAKSVQILVNHNVEIVPIEQPIGLNAATALACTDLAYVPLFHNYLKTNDLNHPVDHDMSIAGVLGSHPWCKETIELAVGCLKMPSQSSINDMVSESVGPKIEPEMFDLLLKKLIDSQFTIDDKEHPYEAGDCFSYIHGLEEILTNVFPDKKEGELEKILDASMLEMKYPSYQLLRDEVK